MVGSNYQLQNSRPSLLGSSRPCHSPSVPHDAWHNRHTWHQRWSQIGVVCSMNIQHGSIGTYFIPNETVWKPVAHGQMVSYDRHAGPTFGCALSEWTETDNWVRVQWKAGLDNCVDNTPCCYRKPPAVNIWHRGGDFTVYHWGLNKQCSWINKNVGWQIPGWYCVQFSVWFAPKLWQFHHFYSSFATVLTWLHFLSLTPIPQSLQQIYFVASTYLFIFTLL